MQTKTIVRYYPILNDSHINLKSSNSKGLGKNMANLETSYSVGVGVGTFFWGAIDTI